MLQVKGCFCLQFCQLQTCKDRNAQAGWACLSQLDAAQRRCMLDYCAGWDLPFWKQFKIPSSTTEVLSGPALGQLGAVGGLGSAFFAYIRCAECSLCPHQPLPLSETVGNHTTTCLQLQVSIVCVYLGMVRVENLTVQLSWLERAALGMKSSV